MTEQLRTKLRAIADEIVDTIIEKDVAYGSSWKSHGGFSAFFNLDRKWSRVQNMSQEQKYDLFAAMHIYPDGPDALQDLIAYAMLTLTETYNPPGYVDPEADEGFAECPDEDAAHVIETREMLDGMPDRDYVDQD